MSGPTSLSWFVVWVCFLVRVSGGETEKTAKPGESVDLQCRADGDIIYVAWRRGDDTVCETKNPDNTQCQNVFSSFMDRVHLTEGLKSKDASLTLTNVKETDAGKYECYVKQLPGGHDMEPLCTVSLEIGDTGGGATKVNIVLVVSLIICLIIVFVLVVLLVKYRQCVKRHLTPRPRRAKSFP